MREFARRVLPALLCLPLLCACESGSVPAAANTGLRAEAPLETGRQDPFLALTVDERPFTLPATLLELEAAGYYVSSEGASDAVPPRGIGAPVAISGNGVTFTGLFYNPDARARPIAEDMPLVRARFDAQGQTANVGLAGGVIVGESYAEDVTALFGDPLDRSGGEDGTLELLYGRAGERVLCVAVDRSTERIVAVELVCYVYEGAEL